MLQSLRKSAGSIVIKALFGLLVVSFAVWGIGDSYFSGQPDDTVANVGSRSISVAELRRNFRAEVERLRPLNIDEAKARELGFLDQALNRLIDATLFDEGARKMGMAVSEAALRKNIRDQLGDIGAAEFENVLRNNGMSEQQYLARLRGQIIRSQYLDSLADGARAPKPLTDRLYAWREETREAAFVTIPVDPKGPVRNPTAREIKDYYKAHPREYTAPEYRQVSYIHLDPKIVEKTIKVDEAKLREIYGERRETLGVPEKRQLQQMLLPDAAAAQRATEMLKSGKDFLAVAGEVAQQDKSATELGTVTKAELPQQLAEAAFKLKSGEFSEPVKGPFGLHIIRAALIVPGKTPSFEDVRATLEKEIAREEALESIFAQVNGLEDTLGGGGTLNDAADALGVPLRTVAGLDSEGRDPNDKPIAKLPGAPFVKTAFETGEGEESLVVETVDNGFFVVRVESIVKPALRPLDAIRAEVVDDWKSDQRWTAARERAKKVVENLNKGGKIAEVARKNKWKLQQSRPFTRNGRDAPADMPPSLVADLFAAKTTGRAYQADGTAGVRVARLSKITDVRSGADAKRAEALRESLKLGIANDIAAQLGTALRARHDVSIDQNTIRYYFYSDAGGS